MSQENFFAKQEDRFASFQNLVSHLGGLQRLHQENILAGIRRRQERRFGPVREGSLKAPSLQDWQSYGLDFTQRTLLFWDTLRQRGDNALAHEREGFPVLLKFDYEVVLNGSTLPAPVNYCLLRILPGPDQFTDESLPPLIVIDPRGGHGAGIGGFKQDSAIGESLRAGHPTYFIAFSHEPEPGQTLDDIGVAQARFLELVSSRHPKAGKPVVIGNCQAGWALMGLAAMRPELPGLVIVNGAPLSYWAGVNGRNPMRYSGGLLGGAWMTRLGSDIGNGRFDGIWLVSNFESLDPANTYWSKYYNLFTNVDTEPPRFLDFERWWSSPVLFNREEIETIVDDLFIGNRLSGANLRKGSHIDLRRITAPVVVFCSNGDNITPPQQALNWIADLYPSDLALHSAGRTIVYLKHASIGHLGIFVSSQVARREHRQMIGAIEAIHALPPGLYELVIDDMPNNGQGPEGYKVHFEPRRIADILSNDDDGRDDEREFNLVDRVSEMNSSVYDWTVRPWLQQLINEPIAKLLRHAHPFRQERMYWSSLNPALWWLPSAARSAAANRRPVGANNPLLAWQNFFAATFEDSLDAWRDIRDATQEMAFHAFYGGLSTLTGGSGVKTRRTTTHQDQALIDRLREALPNGGRIDAAMRVLLLLASASGKLDKDMLRRLLADYRMAARSSAQVPDAEALREVAYLQNMLVFAFPQESLETLPLLLPELTERQQVLEAVARIEPEWQRRDGPLGELWRELYRLMELPVADFARLTAELPAPARELPAPPAEAAAPQPEPDAPEAAAPQDLAADAQSAAAETAPETDEHTGTHEAAPSLPEVAELPPANEPLPEALTESQPEPEQAEPEPESAMETPEAKPKALEPAPEQTPTAEAKPAEEDDAQAAPEEDSTAQPTPDEVAATPQARLEGTEPFAPEQTIEGVAADEPVTAPPAKEARPRRTPTARKESPAKPRRKPQPPKPGPEQE